MNENLEIICGASSGEPILLCPVEIAAQWEGINKPSASRVVEATFHLNGPNGVKVDYDRACDAADEYISTIDIGAGEAFVFGDEIPSMYWINSDAFTGGYALTWVYLPEDDEPDYQKVVATLPDNFFSETGLVITCSNKGFLLFPSTQSPADTDYFDSVDVPCPAGSYTAAIGFYEKPDISLRIIKIQRQD